MLKTISKFLLILLLLIYLALIWLLPFEWYKIGMYGEIFPALDIIIIYYLSTYKKIQYWHLFIIGLFIDQLYHFPLGVSPLVFIFMSWFLRKIGEWFLLKNYITNYIIFCIYSMCIIFLRYMFITIKGINHIEGFAIFFYYLTTIFSYPIVRTLIERPIKILEKYVR